MNSKLPPNEQIEIEAKLGNILFNHDVKLEQKNMLKFLS